MRGNVVVLLREGIFKYFFLTPRSERIIIRTIGYGFSMYENIKINNITRKKDIFFIPKLFIQLLQLIRVLQITIIRIQNGLYSYLFYIYICTLIGKGSLYLYIFYINT